MIPIKLEVSVLFALLIYFICVVYLIKKRTLSLKYSLMWLFSGTIILLIVLFPGFFSNIMSALGIVQPANGLFAVCIFLLLVMLLVLTAIISKMNNKIRDLAQTLGIAEKRIRDLEREHDSK